MITNYQIPLWSQRDPKWSKQRLGTVNGTTIGTYGCLITCISMMNAGFDPGNQLTPNQVDDKFTNGAGYANGNLVVWNAINRLLPNAATAGQISCKTTPAPVGDIKAHLDQGQLAILQVGFGGNPDKMHFVLAVGYNGDDIIFNDPWYGDRVGFSSNRYGTGHSAQDILVIHYFADAISNQPVKPEVPVAKLPSEQPVLGYQRRVRPGIHVNYRKAADPGSEIIKKFDPGVLLDFKGFVHGADVEGNNIWFVGRYSNGYCIATAFEDSGTHDLPDLTPAAPALEPVADPEPQVVVEPTPEPVVEPELVVLPMPEPAPEVPGSVLDNIPEWDASYVGKNIGELEKDPNPKEIRTVMHDGVFAVDMTGSGEPKPIPKGAEIKIAGYFTDNGKSYARTVYSVLTGWPNEHQWYGVDETAFIDETNLDGTPIPVTVVPKETTMRGLNIAKLIGALIGPIIRIISKIKGNKS